MSDLDDKLFDTLSGFTRQPVPVEKDFASEVRNLVAQIKQAFADEGEFTLSNITFEDANKHTLSFRQPIDTSLMAGKDWFAKFEKEFKTYSGDYSTGWQAEVVAIAKRAAGMSND